MANAAIWLAVSTASLSLGLTRPKAVKTADANREQPSPGPKADVNAEQTASLHFLAAPMPEMDRAAWRNEIE